MMMKINKIYFRQLVAYQEARDEESEKKKGWAYMRDTIQAGIDAGIIEDLTIEQVDKMQPDEVLDINNKFLKALTESIQPETKN